MEDTQDVQKWLEMIATYENTFKKWESRVDKILKRYRDDTRDRGQTGAKFNILWSNVQTVIPAVFSRLPKPDVSRRFRDNDPIGRVASLLLERALEFEIEHYPDYRAAMENSVTDRFLGGRGVSWVRYEPHFGAPDDGFQITEDADEAENEQAQEEIKYECAPVDYVHWKDFGHSIARTWEEVTAVWRKVYMMRPALVERFGEDIGNKIPLDTKPEELKKSQSDGDYQALIYEIWDKESGKALWVSKSLGEIVDERDDPLDLENFFPCARPLYATLTSDSLEPVPDFSLYQDQARELDTLADRIAGLIDALRIRGVYDASAPELSRLFTEGDNNKLIPVNNWQAFAEKQGLKGAIDLVDITPIAAALVEAYKAEEQIKNQIYEIMGIADILRGSTDPNETLGAQKMKGQFGCMRLRAMQNKVVQFATELLRIKAEIMCLHFQPETLVKIGGGDQLSPDDQHMIPQALQLLKNEPLRNFRIEVSSDSMVQLDDTQDKADRMEFLKASGSFLQQALPVVQESPQIAPLLVEMLKFGVTAFKVGKTIEGQFDHIMDGLEQAQKNPQPKPNPELMKIQAQSQAQQQEMQFKAQLDQQQMQMEMQAEQHKQQLQAAQIQQQNEIEAQRAQLQAQHQAQLDQMKMQHEATLEAQRIQLDKYKIDLDSATKIEVAKIGSQPGIDEATDSAVQTIVGDLSNNVAQLHQQLQDSHTQAIQAIQQVADQARQPKEIVRDGSGRAVGIKHGDMVTPIKRDPSGKVIGV